MALASSTRSTGEVNSLPLIITGRPCSKPIVTSSVAISMVESQNGTPMIGSTISMPASRCSSTLASWVAPQMFASVEYAFSVLSR